MGISRVRAVQRHKKKRIGKNAKVDNISSGDCWGIAIW